MFADSGSIGDGAPNNGNSTDTTTTAAKKKSKKKKKKEKKAAEIKAAECISSNGQHYHPTDVIAPLVAVLKVFLAQEGLFKGGDGGIGSFRLYVTVSAFLDTHRQSYKLKQENYRQYQQAHAAGIKRRKKKKKKKTTKASQKEADRLELGVDLDKLLIELFDWSATHITTDGTISSVGYTTTFPKGIHKLPHIQAALKWGAEQLRSKAGPGPGSGLATVVDSNQLKAQRDESLEAARGGGRVGGGRRGGGRGPQTAQGVAV